MIFLQFEIVISKLKKRSRVECCNDTSLLLVVDRGVFMSDKCGWKESDVSRRHFKYNLKLVKDKVTSFCVVERAKWGGQAKPSGEVTAVGM